MPNPEQSGAPAGGYRPGVPAIRLFCFPHAGGGALAFRPWHEPLGPEIEVVPVVLPGRESRWHEPAYTDMDTLVDGTIRELADRLQPPFAFFGHSLGAAVGYELCRRYFPDGGGPVRLLVSARRAPHLPARHRPAHSLPRDELVAYLRMLGGIPPELLGHLEVLDGFLPPLRADFQVNEQYAPPRGQPLPVPVSAFLGEDDPAVTVAEMLCWRDVTSREFRLRVFAGGHFYLTGGPAELLAAVRSDLTSAAAPAGVEGRRWGSG